MDKIRERPSWYGSIPSMAACALCSLAEATIFMAEVIFKVPLMELMRLLISFSDAICASCP